MTPDRLAEIEAMLELEKDCIPGHRGWAAEWIRELLDEVRLLRHALDKALFVVGPNPFRLDDVPHAHCRCVVAIKEICADVLAGDDDGGASK